VNLEQEECERKLRKQQNKEYLELMEFLEFLQGFYMPGWCLLIIKKWIMHHQSDTIGGIMALKVFERHHGKVLSNKERKKLKHVLNGNMAVQAACIAIATSAITYLIRRN
jgi:hypothetical protein